jgi:hypothetical protein
MQKVALPIPSIRTSRSPYPLFVYTGTGFASEFLEWKFWNDRWQNAFYKVRCLSLLVVRARVDYIVTSSKDSLVSLYPR